MSLNKVIIIGRLGQNPSLKYSQNGKAVCNFNLAVSEKYKDSNGEKKERTDWLRIVVWGKLAELCSQYTSKGKQVSIEGKLQTRSYEKENQKHYVTEIVATNVVFLGSEQKQEVNGNQQSNVQDNFANFSADDIPF